MPDDESRPQEGGRAPRDPGEKSPPTGEQPDNTGSEGPTGAAAPGEKPADAPKPPQETVTLTVDGRWVTVPKGTLVVEAAKTVNIEIPVFCYHHKLAPVGACRLCLVELSPGPPKPQTACTTPVADGMVVKTGSELATAARADILEFELVNHPLDCPVCDKGGECPLQDFTFRHGYPVSRLDDPKVHFRKPVPLSDSIALDRERCVLCYRCTRYYDEIAWEQELTTDERGVKSFITSQFDQPLRSIFSGNIIDLCPVGALTSRVWRFESRPWDMQRQHSVCSKCAVGCNVTLWQRRQQLVRVTAHENDDIDDGWICDRGRFVYTHVNDSRRIRRPAVAGRAAGWDEALTRVAEATKGRGQRLGVSLPQDVTNEELYLLARFLEGPWKGARVVMENRSLLPVPPERTARIRDLDDAGTLVIVASDVRDDSPIVDLRVKKASHRGAHLVVVHPDDVDLDRAERIEHHRPRTGGIATAVRRLSGARFDGPVVVLYGDARGAENVDGIVDAVTALASASGGTLLPLHRGTNERGALAAGVLPPGETGLDGVDTLFCWGPPPTGGVPASVRQLIHYDTLPRDGIAGDIVLPDISFAESQGSYTSLDGTVQFIRPVLELRPPLREGWEVLGELGLALGLDTVFGSIFDVQRRAAQTVPAWSPLARAEAAAPETTGPVMLGPARP
jgi:NADH dehydrogenase/NADH:ubiquinone oxidoreductase subunit G